MISLPQLIKLLSKRGIEAPYVIRFPDILRAEVCQLNLDFRSAIRKHGYAGRYRGAFPIKVNQFGSVVREIAAAGEPFGMGLEAGSKPELIAALDASRPGGLIICNGQKDSDFIDLALAGQRLGFEVILVVETPREIGLILERAALAGIDPLLGFRARLWSEASGHWSATNGHGGVFGMGASAMLRAVDQLGRAGKLRCLRLLHYHQGSQISGLAAVRQAATEAAHLYAQLHRAGAPLGILDIGGGLAVDYDGNGSAKASSREYSARDYASTAVEAVASALAAVAPEIPVPDLVSESGRALASHFSVLVFSASLADAEPGREAMEEAAMPPEVRAIVDFAAERRSGGGGDLEAGLTARIDAMRDRFGTPGGPSLHDLAAAEAAVREICAAGGAEAFDGGAFGGATFLGNLSIFQSLPDYWAIGQTFPIMPLQRLHERPDCLARINDLTCDSDGVLDRFFVGGEERRGLPAHFPQRGQPYHLGAFLVGAYQEILGDNHNLFGVPAIISISAKEGAEFEIRHIPPRTSGRLLGTIGYKPSLLAKSFRRHISAAAARGEISESDAEAIAESHRRALETAPYLDPSPRTEPD